MTMPASVPVDGFLGVRWVAAIANPAAPNATTEINAVSSLDISCYLTGNGFQNGLDEQTIVDGRLCQRQNLERPGKFTKSLSLRYVHNPASPADNEAYLTLTYLTEGFVVARYGVPFDDPWAADDIVDVYPVQCGQQLKVPTEENNVFTVMQKMFIRDGVQDDVVLV